MTAPALVPEPLAPREAAGRRLLGVSYSFPPLHNAQSLLVERTVRALSGMGWQVTMLTVNPGSTMEPVDDALTERIPRAVEVVRTASLERRLFAAPPSLERILRHSLHFCGLPEKQFPWYFSACRAGRRLLGARRFDIIHSWACYHTSNVVGLALKRWSGLPLVAHFSDPWVDNPFHFLWPLQRAVCRRLEAAVIREADAVVFVTEQAAAKVMAKYPAAWRQKVHVIPHGYDSAVPARAPARAPKGAQRLRLTYAGSFYGPRNPEAFLRALARLGRGRALEQELAVVLCGPGVPRYAALARSLELQRIVECRGPLGFDEARQAMAEADVLLVIDAPSEGPSLFLASKVVDYLAFGKPILGLTPAEGATADLLGRLGGPVAPPDDEGAIAAAIAEILGLWRRGVLRIAPEFAQVARAYEGRATAGRLDSLLASLARGAAVSGLERMR
ncbi:MAG TPA: glycosyltransferase [Bryobacterales bacterium]|nr:glycosyltransferase [Bryobacterales bacterium]